MASAKSMFLLCLIAFFTCFSYSQNCIKELDYTAIFNKDAIELVFDVPVTVKAYDSFNASEISIVKEQKEHSFLILNVKPAQIIKLSYTFLSGKSTAVQTSYLASPSTSSGTITVYFNHPVDVTYAQTQNAVNLSNTLDDMLISYINACVSTLDIAIYNSYSPSGTTGIAGAINAAYARGVQVRLIYDGSTSSTMIPLLNPLIPILASPTTLGYGIMHNKFVIFDANSTDANKPVLWTGSTNWTVSQIDGPDKNSAIIIQDQALALGYKIEFEEMWGSTTMTPNTTLSKFGPYKTNNTPHTYIIGGKTVNSYFSPSDGANAKIIAAINTANSDIEIATMLITRTDISAALIAKFNSGITNLNVVLDSQNPVSNQLVPLQTAINTSRVVVATGSGIMHHKFMVIDNFNSASDPQVLVGSHNWSTAAETKNDENMLIVHDANITNQYYQAFAYLFQQSGGVLSTNNPVTATENIVAYPNPTTGIVHLTSANNRNESVAIHIYNVLGELVFEKQHTNFTTETIDLSSQASGMYYVAVIADAKETHFKIVKQ
jgi:phosphatidylserine/phosphatidylglycerophosphate/cardiolipin synthase-like enzyme